VTTWGVDVAIITQSCGASRRRAGVALAVRRGSVRAFRMSDAYIEIIVNGERGLADRRVAVERNREVIPRARHGEVVLGADDRLELVTFVGGG
jgi:sulfur carrier protein